MEAKEFAKMFGGFSTERRVLIVSALLDAGKDGISLIELSRKTELSVIDIGIAAEALLLMGLLNISVKGENKILSANYKMLSSLFEDAYNTLGPGRHLIKKAEAEAEEAQAQLEQRATPSQYDDPETRMMLFMICQAYWKQTGK